MSDEPGPGPRRHRRSGGSPAGDPPAVVHAKPANPRCRRPYSTGRFFLRGPRTHRPPPAGNEGNQRPARSTPPVTSAPAGPPGAFRASNSLHQLLISTLNILLTTRRSSPLRLEV